MSELNESKATCQICEKEYDVIALEKWIEKNCPRVPYDSNPQRFMTCSFECLIMAHRSNAVLSFIRFMKQNRSFENFNSVFNFGTAGDYAKEKHEKYSSDPWFFVHSLSHDKIILMARNRDI